MKKFLLIFIPILIVVIIAVVIFFVLNGGFSLSKSHTFFASNDDEIKISLKTKENYDIDYGKPFTVSENSNKVSQGTFINSSAYDQYLASINAQKSTIKILDSGSRDDVEYTFYTTHNSKLDCEEYNYIIKIKNSNTGLLLSNIVSQESAEKCFGILKFSKIK